MNELLKDICSRIPYGLKVCVPHISVNSVFNLIGVQAVDKELTTAILTRNNGNIHVPINLVKPYLFPLSSMTEEQKDVYYNQLDMLKPWNIVDWLNAHHFDYNGLIEKSLALDATNLNIY